LDRNEGRSYDLLGFASMDYLGRGWLALERLGTVAIIGVGLIGGSVGLALRARGLARRVIGIGRNPEGLDEARRLGAIDEGTTEISRGVAEAEVAVVCTPVTRIGEDIRSAAEHGPELILVTDAGSTKRRIVEAVERDARSRAVFVAGHPLAGSERRGAAHARADLFERRVCVLTPTERTPTDRLDRARAFWSMLGCQIVEITPDAHDRALALTSHLPHAVAAALAAAVPVEALALAAGAYRDGTRVAGSDAALWAGIFRENRVPVLQALEQFQNQLEWFRQALEADDEQGLRSWWETAKAHRARFRLPDTETYEGE
jgi:prephenate dehydrogenase